MASYTLTTLADSRQDGPILTVDLQTAWALATQGPSAFVQVVNQALVQAEQGAPEGAWLLLQLQGWTLPVIGSVGPQVAAQIEQAWEAGQITYQEGPDAGQPVQNWPVPDFNGQFAVYDPDTDSVVINAVKRQGPIVIIILSVLGILVGIALIQTLTGQFGYTWKLGQGFQPQSSSPPPATGGLGAWWAGLPFLDKAAIVLGGAGVLAFGAWVWAEERIHAAGASRSNIEIINER